MGKISQIDIIYLLIKLQISQVFPNTVLFGLLFSNFNDSYDHLFPQKGFQLLKVKKRFVKGCLYGNEAHIICSLVSFWEYTKTSGFLMLFYFG